MLCEEELGAGAEPWSCPTPHPLNWRWNPWRTRTWQGWGHGMASTYQLMALGLALQLLVVVEGEAVQHGVLLLVHRSHGALLVDLVDVDLLLALQDGVPPVLVPFVQVDLGSRSGSEESGERSPRPAPGMCYPRSPHASVAVMSP